MLTLAFIRSFIHSLRSNDRREFLTGSSYPNSCISNTQPNASIVSSTIAAIIGRGNFHHRCVRWVDTLMLVAYNVWFVIFASRGERFVYALTKAWLHLALSKLCNALKLRQELPTAGCGWWLALVITYWWLVNSVLCSLVCDSQEHWYYLLSSAIPKFARSQNRISVAALLGLILNFSWDIDGECSTNTSSQECCRILCLVYLGNSITLNASTQHYATIVGPSLVVCVIDAGACGQLAVAKTTSIPKLVRDIEELQILPSSTLVETWRCCGSYNVCICGGDCELCVEGGMDVGWSFVLYVLYNTTSLACPWIFSLPATWVN